MSWCGQRRAESSSASSLGAFPLRRYLASGAVPATWRYPLTTTCVHGSPATPSRSSRCHPSRSRRRSLIHRPVFPSPTGRRFIPLSSDRAEWLKWLAGVNAWCVMSTCVDDGGDLLIALLSHLVVHASRAGHSRFCYPALDLRGPGAALPRQRRPASLTCLALRRPP